MQEDLAILAAEAERLGFAGKSILITGATGLIGSLCVKAFLEHNRRYPTPISVIALARDPDKAARVYRDEPEAIEAIPNVRFVFRDITELIPPALRCDYIIHTASVTSSRLFVTRPVEVIEGIYQGTRQVLEYAREHAVEGLVYLSSMEVFGSVDTERRLREDELGQIRLDAVRSCYPEAKRLAELLCHCYAEEYGVPVRVARLAQTFGAGVGATENRVFAQFARSALRGEDIVLHTRGKSVGNYCYTRDTIRALFLLLTAGEKGAAYSVVNEETSRSIAEMAALVAEKFSNGRSRVVFDIPEDGRYGYAPDTKLRLSADKIRALGWQAEIDLEEMYRRMLPDLEEK